MKVFLGGTCNKSKWREEIIPYLEAEGLSYFNPVVDDWDSAAMERELIEREKCDFCLYVITPKMTGIFSISEATDDSNKRPKKTVFVYLDEDGNDRFDEFQLRSLDRTAKLIEGNGGKVCDGLESATIWMGKIQKLMEKN